MTRQCVQLDRELLNRLKSASSSAGTSAAGNVEADDYDWSMPHCFTRDQLEKLNLFARSAAKGLCERLTGLLRTQLEFTAQDVTEHYACKLSEGLGAGADYVVPILADGRQCGMIVLPAQSAIGWVGKLLGGGESQGGGEKTLSTLETSILMDIFTAVGVGISKAFSQSGGRELDRGEGLLDGEFSPDGNGSDAYCRFALDSESSQTGPAVAFAIRSDVLAPIFAGKHKVAESSPQQRRSYLLAYLGEACVDATVWLNDAHATMRDIMALDVGDVLVLDNKADGAATLVVQGREIVSGFPVVCEGRYAMRVQAPPS